jgi:hypothetical protein
MQLQAFSSYTGIPMTHAFSHLHLRKGTQNSEETGWIKGHRHPLMDTTTTHLGPASELKIQLF